MDLIYSNEKRQDVGVILRCNLDLAYGKDENDFELEMDIEDSCLKPNYFIYVENTEYGGIVDDINPSSSNNTIKYIGRTWHGIMDSKILKPDKGKDYLIVEGDAHAIIKQLLVRCGIESLFCVTEEASNIMIENYSFPRYIGLYQGLRKMLYAFGGKLNIVFSNGMVNLSVSPYVDYSNNEEWDSSVFATTINKHFNPVNHLYCLGSGDLKNRYAIELFTDKDGAVQPYATVSEPYKDSQYILDNRNQILLGIRERSAVYDNKNAQVVENYKVLEEKPSNWNESYFEYYEHDVENDTYKQLEKECVEEYKLLTAKPYDWNKNYSSYYYKDGEDYKSVDDKLVNKTTTYPLLEYEPSDWKTNYKDYYYYWTDGVEEEYKSVSADSYNYHKEQEQIPTDWSTNKGSYYVKITEYAYTYEFKKKRNGVWDRWEKTYEFKIDEFEKKDYICTLKNKKVVRNEYIKISDYIKEKDSRGKQKAKLSDFKNWNTSKYRPFFTQYTGQKAPVFDSKKYRFKSEAMTNPLWSEGKFYNKVQGEVIPYFWQGGYFKKELDDYAELVSGGIEKLKEYWDLDEIDVSLSPESGIYDIGDVVGATESVTGISVSSQITKKIVTIDTESNISIQYELGNEEETKTY